MTTLSYTGQANASSITIPATNLVGFRLNPTVAGTISKSGGLAITHSTVGAALGDDTGTALGTNITWSGGTPTASGTQTTGIASTWASTNSGVKYSIPVTAGNVYTVVIRSGTYACTATVTASLQDASASSVSTTITGGVTKDVTFSCTTTTTTTLDVQSVQTAVDTAGTGNTHFMGLWVTSVASSNPVSSSGTLSAVATYTATSNPGRTSGAALSAVATYTATPNLARTSTAALSATATYAATANLIHTTAAALTGTATFTATPTLIVNSEYSNDNNGVQDYNGNTSANVSSGSYANTSYHSQEYVPGMGLSGTATLNAFATFTANAYLLQEGTPVSSTGTLSVTAAFNASSVIAATSSGTLNVLATFTASSDRVVPYVPEDKKPDALPGFGRRKKSAPKAPTTTVARRAIRPPSQESISDLKRAIQELPLDIDPLVAKALEDAQKLSDKLHGEAVRHEILRLQLEHRAALARQAEEDDVRAIIEAAIQHRNDSRMWMRHLIS
jgi:hypothetical protein